MKSKVMIAKNCENCTIIFTARIGEDMCWIFFKLQKYLKMSLILLFACALLCIGNSCFAVSGKKPAGKTSAAAKQAAADAKKAKDLGEAQARAGNLAKEIEGLLGTGDFSIEGMVKEITGKNTQLKTEIENISNLGGRVPIAATAMHKKVEEVEAATPNHWRDKWKKMDKLLKGTLAKVDQAGKNKQGKDGGGGANINLKGNKVFSRLHDICEKQIKATCAWLLLQKNEFLKHPLDNQWSSESMRLFFESESLNFLEEQAINRSAINQFIADCMDFLKLEADPFEDGYVKTFSGVVGHSNIPILMAQKLAFGRYSELKNQNFIIPNEVNLVNFLHFWDKNTGSFGGELIDNKKKIMPSKLHKHQLPALLFFQVFSLEVMKEDSKSEIFGSKKSPVNMPGVLELARKKFGEFLENSETNPGTDTKVGFIREKVEEYLKNALSYVKTSEEQNPQSLLLKKKMLACVEQIIAIGAVIGLSIKDIRRLKKEVAAMEIPENSKKAASDLIAAPSVDEILNNLKKLKAKLDKIYETVKKIYPTFPRIPLFKSINDAEKEFYKAAIEAFRHMHYLNIQSLVDIAEIDAVKELIYTIFSLFLQKDKRSQEDVSLNSGWDPMRTRFVEYVLLGESQISGTPRGFFAIVKSWVKGSNDDQIDSIISQFMVAQPDDVKAIVKPDLANNIKCNEIWKDMDDMGHDTFDFIEQIHVMTKSICEALKDNSGKSGLINDKSQAIKLDLETTSEAKELEKKVTSLLTCYAVDCIEGKGRNVDKFAQYLSEAQTKLASLQEKLKKEEVKNKTKSFFFYSDLGSEKKEITKINYPMTLLSRLLGFCQLISPSKNANPLILEMQNALLETNKNTLRVNRSESLLKKYLKSRGTLSYGALNKVNSGHTANDDNNCKKAFRDQCKILFEETTEEFFLFKIIKSSETLKFHLGFLEAFHEVMKVCFRSLRDDWGTSSKDEIELAIRAAVDRVNIILEETKNMLEADPESNVQEIGKSCQREKRICQEMIEMLKNMLCFLTEYQKMASGDDKNDAREHFVKCLEIIGRMLEKIVKIGKGINDAIAAKVKKNDYKFSIKEMQALTFFTSSHLSNLDNFYKALEGAAQNGGSVTTKNGNKITLPMDGDKFKLTPEVLIKIKTLLEAFDGQFNNTFFGEETEVLTRQKVAEMLVSVVDLNKIKHTRVSPKLLQGISRGRGSALCPKKSLIIDLRNNFGDSE